MSPDMIAPITSNELPRGDLASHTPMMAQYLRMTFLARNRKDLGLKF